MNKRKLSISLLFLTYTAFAYFAQGQVKIENYGEWGINQLNPSGYGSFSTKASIPLLGMEVKPALLVSTSVPSGSFINAAGANIERDFSILKLPLKLGVWGLFKPISSLMNETDYALYCSFPTGKFTHTLGFNTRFLAFNHAAVVNYHIADNEAVLWEKINFMYRLAYHFNISQKWKIEVCATNFDTYFIEQETNPFLILNLSYTHSQGLELFSDVGYMEAGLLNIKVNYFGMFFRGGVRWKI